MNEQLKAAQEYDINPGMRRCTMSEIRTTLRTLGYRLESPCYSMGRDSHGRTFPAVTFMIKEIDTGKSAFHYESRRDENFKELQAFRSAASCIHRGRLVVL